MTANLLQKHLWLTDDDGASSPPCVVDHGSVLVQRGLDPTRKRHPQITLQSKNTEFWHIVPHFRGLPRSIEITRCLPDE
jgi:hypothetical protein